MHDALIDIVRRAGTAVLDVYDSAFTVATKDDDSPLTQADLRAHEIIVRGLEALTPALPILSEESQPPPFEVRRSWRRYWLVDPLDGTKEFIGRNGEFTVNIALIDAGTPVLGVVGVPVRGSVYVGDCRGPAAWREDADGTRTPLATRAMGPGGVTVVASRRHGGARLAGYLDALGETFGTVRRKPVGSSLKLCILADGEADLYPRLGPTSEWDIAAAHAVLAAAGGAVMRFDGSALAYNAKESLLNPDFLAVADRSFPWAERLPSVA